MNCENRYYGLSHVELDDIKKELNGYLVILNDIERMHARCEINLTSFKYHIKDANILKIFTDDFEIIQLDNDYKEQITTKIKEIAQKNKSKYCWYGCFSKYYDDKIEFYLQEFIASVANNILYHYKYIIQDTKTDICCLNINNCIKEIKIYNMNLHNSFRYVYKYDKYKINIDFSNCREIQQTIDRINTEIGYVLDALIHVHTQK